MLNVFKTEMWNQEKAIKGDLTCNTLKVVYGIEYNLCGIMGDATYMGSWGEGEGRK
jgi:hypothetical protein